MKKITVYILAAVMLLFTAGCTKATDADKIINEQIIEQETQSIVFQESEETKSTQSTSSYTESVTKTDPPETQIDLPEDTDPRSVHADVDLTKMSATMVYAEVYNIMTEPDAYLGKKIRARGPFDALDWEETNLTYYYVIISDATACCQTGIEFIWDDNTHAYPEDYPAKESIIEIVGTFSSYEELGKTYYYISTEDITVL